jgi:hypothetical protein
MAISIEASAHDGAAPAEASGQRFGRARRPSPPQRNGSGWPPDVHIWPDVLVSLTPIFSVNESGMEIVVALVRRTTTMGSSRLARQQWSLQR